LFQVKAGRGEQFVIRSVKPYSMGQFASDYNRRPISGLEEVRLEVSNLKVVLRVGPASLILQDSKLRTFRGEAVLQAKLDGVCPLQIRKGISGFIARLEVERERITALTECPGAILLRYRNKNKMIGESTRIFELPRCGIGSANGAGESAEITIESRPKGFEGEYVVRIPPNLEKDARDRLSLARGFGEYTMLKGEISEAIVNSILSALGCPEITNHPQSRSLGRRSSEKKGPDSLRLVPTGGSAYFEYKWWRGFNMAVWDARKAVKKYCEAFPVPDGRRVEGGYAAILNWEVGSTSARLHVERVL